jgi:replicative DNA helicase
MAKRKTSRSSAIVDDEIVEIADLGAVETYDMTVPETHCFFGNGILVHNSGEIEEDADMVMLLHREREENAEAIQTQLIVAKNRNGPCGTVRMIFRPRCGRFDLEERR